MNKKVIGFLIFAVSVLALAAAGYGIFSNGGSGAYEITTFRGEVIKLYGKGLYRDMSADVAIQGIAQDYITFFAAVPILLAASFFALKGSLRGKIVMAGTFGYFFLTYLFYMAMAMYNEMFLVYVALLSCSFFGMLLSILSIDYQEVYMSCVSKRLVKTGAVFLIFNGTMVMLLWLGTIVPPLLSGKLYPAGIAHYTTMIVQGFDMGLFLPAAFVSGIMVLRNNKYGTVFVMVYTVFLSLLMSALSSKIWFMAQTGANVVPVVFIMPTINIAAVIFTILFLKNIKNKRN